MINTEHLKYCHHVIGYLESSLILFFDCYKICKFDVIISCYKNVSISA